MPRSGWDEELEKSKTDVECLIRGQWRVEIDGKSQLRELYITLRNEDDDKRLVISIRSAPPEQ